MAYGSPKRVQLATEDAVRMQRLYEEVSARLREMALIVGRTTGVQIGPDVIPKFAPAPQARAGVFPTPPGAPVDLEIEIFDLPDGTHCCYDYLRQECACPC
jgi:hypothetical protein